MAVQDYPFVLLIVLNGIETTIPYQFSNMLYAFNRTKWN